MSFLRKGRFMYKYFKRKITNFSEELRLNLRRWWERVKRGLNNALLLDETFCIQTNFVFYFVFQIRSILKDQSS